MKKSQAIADRYISKLFHFSAGTQTFFADYSELFRSAGRSGDLFEQLWADEGQKGFVMVSARTGDEVPFVLDHTEREADGDVRSWRMVPHMHAISQNERLRKVSIIVFNT